MQIQYSVEVERGDRFDERDFLPADIARWLWMNDYVDEGCNFSGGGQIKIDHPRGFNYNNRSRIECGIYTFNFLDAHLATMFALDFG